MVNADWWRTLQREAGFRRCIVLYGNVRDLWYDANSGRYLRLSQLLTSGLNNFDIRARWDRIDGLKFPDNSQLQRFIDTQQMMMPSTDEGDDYDLDADDQPPSPAPSSTRFGDEVTAGGMEQAENAFPAMRMVLQSDYAKSLFVLDWSEHLLTSANQQDIEERLLLTNLAKAVSDQPQSQLTGTALGQATGLLVIVTPTLGALPPEFYNHDSRIRILPIPTPDLEQRRALLSNLSGDLLVKMGEGQGTYQAAASEILAELTDGMTCVDLRNIVALSKQSTNAMGPEALVNLYKFGEQDSPWEQLQEEKVAQAMSIIKQRVKGQDEAVSRVATMIVRAYLGLSGVQHSKRMTKPKGTLFFVGPTGVGKTELAKALAQFIFGDESNCLRFDMSEFSQEHADQRLIGAPPGYVGFEEGGQLTNAVAEKPFSVLLFDEIEKAHPRVLDKFLQILEDGRLTDGRGQTAHFSESVIIFTSNIGASEVKPGQSRDDMRNAFMTAVANHFNTELKRPELLNRFGDNIIVFDFIDDPEIRNQIMEAKLTGVREHLKERFDLTLDIGEVAIQSFVSQGNVSHGGRGLINVIERELINPMSIFIFENLHFIEAGGKRLVVSLDGHGSTSFKLEEN